MTNSKEIEEYARLQAEKYKKMKKREYRMRYIQKIMSIPQKKEKFLEAKREYARKAREKNKNKAFRKIQHKYTDNKAVMSDCNTECRISEAKTN